jgi:hypothetical protein
MTTLSKLLIALFVFLCLFNFAVSIKTYKNLYTRENNCFVNANEKVCTSTTEYDSDSLNDIYLSCFRTLKKAEFVASKCLAQEYVKMSENGSFTLYNGKQGYIDLKTGEIVFN